MNKKKLAAMVEAGAPETSIIMAVNKEGEEHTLVIGNADGKVHPAILRAKVQHIESGKVRDGLMSWARQGRAAEGQDP